MFLGLAAWVADLLVIFFLPAAFKTGSQGTFLGVISVLAVTGMALMIFGYWARGNADAE